MPYLLAALAEADIRDPEARVMPAGDGCLAAADVEGVLERRPGRVRVARPRLVADGEGAAAQAVVGRGQDRRFEDGAHPVVDAQARLLPRQKAEEDGVAREQADVLGELLAQEPGSERSVCLSWCVYVSEIAPGSLSGGKERKIRENDRGRGVRQRRM